MSEKRWSNVLCLEGLWELDDSSFADRSSVLPLLETLERLDRIRYVHRDVATRAELDWHLNRWINSGATFWTLYLAFHGSPERLHMSYTESVSLEELGEDLAGCLTDVAIYLGSCSVLATKTKAISDFMRVTKAAAVIGYATDVDWLQAAAMDLFVLGHLARYAQLGRALNALERDVASTSLQKHLGLRIHRR